jgi:hypothetical protein
MKFVKKTVSLSPEVYKFADQRAKKLAKTRGTRPNISAVIQEALAAQMLKAA